VNLDDIADRPTISVEKAAQVLGIGRGHAYELARRGELPGVLRLGRRYRVATHRLLEALGVDGDGRVVDLERVKRRKALE
jgi:excisionase family DNA binding protein